MKIATYNLRFGGSANQRTHWNQIFQTIDPDIFLVQETCDPRLYMPQEVWKDYKHQIHWKSTINKAWGNAIFSKSGDITPISIPEFEGYVVGAEIDGFEWTATLNAPLNSKRSLRIFSIHAPAPYKRSVNQILDFIASFPDDRNLILGGDFNVSTGIRHSSEPLQGDSLWFLERLRKEFNLLNCWQTANPNRDLPQTLRWSRDKTKPYHCDGIFVPACWY
jgi:endonuclease/exonuclease/phosphatase family metal-dependent hydrolase